jgi:hypothetical protein
MRGGTAIRRALVLACGYVVVGSSFMALLSVAVGRHPSVWCGTCAASMSSFDLFVLAITMFPFSRGLVALAEGIALARCVSACHRKSVVVVVAVGLPTLTELLIRGSDLLGGLERAVLRPSWREILQHELVPSLILASVPAAAGVVMSLWAIDLQARLAVSASAPTATRSVRLHLVRMLAVAWIALAIFGLGRGLLEPEAVEPPPPSPPRAAGSGVETVDFSLFSFEPPGFTLHDAAVALVLGLAAYGFAAWRLRAIRASPSAAR